MHIVHCAWIPDEPADFVRRGAFYLWVESDSPAAIRKRQPGSPHPRHLDAGELADFVNQRLGLGTSRGLLVDKWFLLPSADGRPLPSHEQAPYVEEDIPDQAELVPWQIRCCPLYAPIASLNDIHFLALQGAEGLQLGSDLLFWHRFSQALKGLIVRERYIPSVRWRQPYAPAGKGRPRHETCRGELFYGWEWCSDEYEALIGRCAAA
ncbi:MAG TPA: ATP-dependent helicase, partial [Chloroflexota bacterium]